MTNDNGCFRKHVIFAGLVFAVCMIIATWLYAMQSGHDSRIRRLEDVAAASAERFEAIRESLKRIEDNLNKRMAISQDQRVQGKSRSEATTHTPADPALPMEASQTVQSN